MIDQLKAKGKTFTWGVAQQESFDKIKIALAIASILSIVDTTKPFVVKIDASDQAIGAILLQEGKPISFESKNLNIAL